MNRLSRSQVREIDRLAIEQYHIPGIVLMENAAVGASNVACEMLKQHPNGPALLICGGGNNGGDGLAIARHLHNRRVKVHIALTIDPAGYKGDAKINWEIARAMNLPAGPFEATMIKQVKPQLIVDAIFGTGLDRAPRDPFAEIARAINASGVPILAIDVPSGLDCDTGKPLGAECIRSSRTVTFVAEKIGFAHSEARPYLGQATVADIGCPRELIA